MFQSVKLMATDWMTRAPYIENKVLRGIYGPEKRYERGAS
jgi:hypothetical protein